MQPMKSEIRTVDLISEQDKKMDLYIRHILNQAGIKKLETADSFELACSKWFYSGSASQFLSINASRAWLSSCKVVRSVMSQPIELRLALP